MDSSFKDNCNLVLDCGVFVDTIKCSWKRGYYISKYSVDNNLWEIIHQGKALPLELSRIYAIRFKEIKS